MGSFKHDYKKERYVYMSGKKDDIQKIRVLLSGGWSDFQKETMEKIYNKIYKRQQVHVKEIRGINDLYHMRFREFMEFTKLQTNEIAALEKECPTIKNPDGTYSCTNLIRHLKAKKKPTEEVKHIDESDINDRQRKTKLEADILEEKLNKLKETMVSKEEVEQAFSFRLKRLLTYLSSTLDIELWKLENKSRFELKSLKDEIIKKALDEYAQDFDKEDLQKEEKTPSADTDRLSKQGIE